MQILSNVKNKCKKAGGARWRDLSAANPNQVHQIRMRDSSRSICTPFLLLWRFQRLLPLYLTGMWLNTSLHERFLWFLWTVWMLLVTGWNSVSFPQTLLTKKAVNEPSLIRFGQARKVDHEISVVPCTLYVKKRTSLRLLVLPRRMCFQLKNTSCRCELGPVAFTVVVLFGEFNRFLIICSLLLTYSTNVCLRKFSRAKGVHPSLGCAVATVNGLQGPATSVIIPIREVICFGESF